MDDGGLNFMLSNVFSWNSCSTTCLFSVRMYCGPSGTSSDNRKNEHLSETVKHVNIWTHGASCSKLKTLLVNKIPQHWKSQSKPLASHIFFLKNFSEFGFAIGIYFYNKLIS